MAIESFSKARALKDTGSPERNFPTKKRPKEETLWREEGVPL